MAETDFAQFDAKTPADRQLGWDDVEGGRSHG